MRLEQRLDVTLPEELGDTTIVVIGLRHMGLSFEEVAEILKVRDTSHLRCLYDVLEITDNPVVRQCVDVGLPAGLSAALPWEGTSVRCRLCGAKINQVPCPVCSIQAAGPAPAEADPDFGPPPPEPEQPTQAEPGSLRRIIVFQERLRLGQAIFHPADSRIGDTVSHLE